jgi:hypothetical protein
MVASLPLSPTHQCIPSDLAARLPISGRAAAFSLAPDSN